ncbi:MAG: hypothetical protein NTU47_18830 [Ignavibacteriales bacterium]|nr:hypothetical protein [Ignavibacteriales bacterium]
MDILWDEVKAKRLKEKRDISLEHVAQLILEKKYFAILDNPGRPKQMIFVISYKGYTHVVPFVFDKDDNIVLKTVFPSRKFHRLYGEGTP